MMPPLRPAPLKIANLSARVVEHPILPHRVIRSAAGVHDRSVFLEVMVEDEEGCRGYGEAATTSLWSGETAASAIQLFESDVRPALAGVTLSGPEETCDLLDASFWGNPFLKGGTDAAVWDLFARRAGVPAWRLFGDREPVAGIPTRVSIGSYPVEQTVALAEEFCALGIRTLKFKVASGGHDDVARLHASREAVGEHVTFVVDYNGAFDSADAAARHIESLAAFDIVAFEQPTKRGRISLLAETRHLTGVPILADEAIFTPDDLEEALTLDAFDILSVYPGKNGGITRTLAMARRAQAAGKPCVIGCNLETDLGLAAMVSIAASLSAFPVPGFASDLAPIYYERPSAQPQIVLADGNILVPSGNGFGVVPVIP